MKTILIIEDEKAITKVLRDKIASEGYRVLDAGNGEEGLWAALAEHPDLILLDILMPRMNGMDSLKKLREDEWGAKVPVMILSNVNDDGRVAEAMKHGTFDYLVKADHTLDEIVEKVKTKLGDL